MLDQRTATLVGRRTSSQARKPPTDNQAEGVGKKEARGALHERHYRKAGRARQEFPFPLSRTRTIVRRFVACDYKRSSVDADHRRPYVAVAEHSRKPAPNDSRPLPHDFSIHDAPLASTQPPSPYRDSLRGDIDARED